MPQIKLENVELVFTNFMEKASEFGGYSYTFRYDKDAFIRLVQETLSKQFKPAWPESENDTNTVLQRLSGIKTYDTANDTVKSRIKENELLITVKSKEHPIKNTLNRPVASGSVCDIIIDIFSFVFNRKKVICIRSHADRGITIKVKHLVQREADAYFESEAETGSPAVSNNEFQSFSDESVPY